MGLPPKHKFSRDEIVEAAVQVVRERGIDGLTAKTLSARLGTSTQPIFTYFDTMDAVRTAVYASAERRYAHCSEEGLREKIPFFGFGMQHIRFAREEPELYRLLFLRKNGGEFGAIAAMRHSQAVVRPSLMAVYRMTAEEADRYFRDLWLVGHSIATLIVTGDCPYSEEEIGRILTGFSLSICRSVKEIPGFAAGTFDRDAEFRALIGGGEGPVGTRG